MMLNATEENRKALASLLGIDEEEAVEKLQTRVTITVADPAGAAFAADLSELIGKTLQVVGPGANPDIEIAVGGPASTAAPVTMTASMRGDGLTVGGAVVRPEWSAVPRFNERICACYAAGVVVARAIGRSCPDPFGVDFLALGIPAGHAPIVFDDDVLAGCGGVGTAFLWALQAVQTSGRLTVVDGKNVSDGNLNRCFFYDGDDVGKPKAERLVARAVGPTGGLAAPAPARSDLRWYERPWLWGLAGAAVTAAVLLPLAVKGGSAQTLTVKPTGSVWPP